VVDFTRTEKQRTAARKNALAQAQADIKGYAVKLKQRLDDKQYLALEKAVSLDELGALLKKLAALEFGGFPLLTKDEITKILDSQLPKQGDKGRSERYVAEAVQAVARGASTALNDAQQKLGSKPGFVEYRDALAVLKAWQDAAPTTLATDTAPRVSKAYKRAQGDIERARRRVEKRRDQFEFTMLAADRQRYFRFLVDLWAPRVPGS